ncbi:MAG: hypothetical protein IJG33_13000, partial [Selenomonadaceae bacterium]|nr:hypothetical protein [Selenomonadaceae bacterium]
MIDFTFDIQRFANLASSVTLNGTTYTMTRSSGASGTITDDDGDGVLTLTVTSGTVSELKSGNNIPNVILQPGNGNFTPQIGQEVTLGNTDVVLSLVTGSVDINITSKSSGGFLLNLKYTTSDGKATFKIGTVEYTFTISETLFWNLYDDGLVELNSYSGYSIKYEDKTYTINRNLDISYKKNENLTFKNISSSNNPFATCTYTENGGTVEVSYTLNSSKILSAEKTFTKDGQSTPPTSWMWKGTPFTGNTVSATATDLDLNSGQLAQVLYVDDSSSFNISNDFFKSMEGSSAFIVKKDSDFSTYYGILTKNSDGTCTLTKNTSGSATGVESINIGDGLTVEIDKGFAKVPITISVSGTTFSSDDSTSSGDSTDYFTVSTVIGGVSVSGSNSVSLGNGTIKTDEASQSITADGYRIFGYGDKNSINNGLTIAVSGDKATVGDIDIGENFSVGANGYTRLNAGLLQLNSSTGKYMLYIGESSTDDGGAVYVDLDNLTNNLVSLVAPSNDVFEIGTTHTYSAAIVDDTSDPNTIFASLNAADGSYTLSTIGNGDATAFHQTAAGTISLTGGTSTTINKALVSSATNIASSTDATFKVDPDRVSGDTFTVNRKTTDSATTIDGATAITLISGTISAKNGQTITLGDGGSVTFKVTSSNNVTVTYNNSTATVTGSAGDTFTLTTGDTTKTYTVNADSGDAMTFSINSSGNVTVNGLDSVNDSFTYDGVNYSVRSAGFVGNSSSSHSLWSATSNHSLTNGSVAVNSLGTGANWSTLVTLSSSAKSVTIPPSSSFSSPSILIDDTFSDIFGTLTGGANSSYSLSSSSDNKLSRISLSSGVSALSLGGGNITNVSIVSSRSSLTVTEDDSTAGYQVTLSGGATSLVGASKASLISGSLTTDKNSLTVTVLDKDIIASNSTINVAAGTSSTNSSITGVDAGEVFSVDGSAYSLSAVGLVSDNKLLSGVKSAFRLSELNTSIASWRSMIAPTNDTLTISETTSSAFVVDNTDNPTTLFAELASLSGGHSMNASGYTTWSDDYTINVDNTTVTLSGGFANKKVAGTSSEAAFTTGSNTFIVKDSEGGAIITSADNITQTAGLIFSSVTTQSIAVDSSGSVVSYAGGGDGLTVSVSGSTATIGGLDTGEIFNVGGNTYSLSAVGLVSNDKLLNSVKSSFGLSELDTSGTSWRAMIAPVSNTLTISDTTSSAFVVNDTDNPKSLFAELISLSGGHSINANGYATWSDNYTIDVDSTTVSLSSGFANKKITGENSKAAFSVDNLTGNVFVVADATTTGGSATITDARKINQTAGTIALSDSRQSIVTGTSTNHSITGASGNGITTYVSGDNVTIGALDAGDSFTADGKTYTLLSNGKLHSDDLIWNGKTIATQGGSIALSSLSGSTWNGLIEASAGNLTIGSEAISVFNSNVTAAYVVSNTSTPTTIYGTLTNSDDGYTLSTTGASDNTSLSSVTVELDQVIFTKDLLNTSIHAGETDFMATATTGKSFTVNYNSTNDEVLVWDATEVSLLSGALTINDSIQTVTANDKTFQAVSGEFTVDYNKDTDKAVVSGIDDATASESLKVNDITYTLLDGDGFGIQTTDDGSSANTTVTGLDTGDKFSIVNGGTSFEFNYTKAGFIRTRGTSTDILSTLSPTSSQLTLAELMTTDNDGTWLGLVEVSSDEVITLDGKLTKSAFLVDSIDNPTKNYGQITYDRDAKTYKLSKFTATSTITEGTPSLISVGSGVTATIDGDFSTIPLTATNATNITVSPANGTSYTISGTINNVDIENKTFTPAEGDSFTVDGTAYLMTGAGLTKTADNQIWTGAGVESYVLPSEGTWSNIVKLKSKGVLDLSSVTVKEGNNVVVTSDTSARRATITYANDSYELSSTDTANLIETVKLANGSPPINIDFATTVQTGSGTYTVNDKAYTTTSGITIYVTANDSTLYAGTVTLDKDKAAVTATNDSNSISVADDGVEITATAKDGSWTSLGSLDNDDTFTIGDTKYKVYGTTTLAKLNSSGEIDTLYNGTITSGALDYDKIVDDANYDSIISLNANSELDLTKTYTIDTTAIVVGVDDDGNIAPTKRVAQLAYNDSQTGYVLSAVTGGNIDNLEAVLLDTTFKVFSTTLETTVSTVGVETFTINDSSFNAQNNLTITTESGNALLTNGKVKLEQDATINTRRTEDSTTISETITNTSGSLTVEVSNNDTVTIGDLNSGESFTYGSSNSYTMTSIGLVTGDKLNPAAAASNSITTAELVGDAWKTMWQTTGGALTINNAVPADAYAVDFDDENPSAAVNYGTLTKTAGVYSFAQTTALTSIAVDGVKVELPAECSQVPITAL